MLRAVVRLIPLQPDQASQILAELLDASERVIERRTKAARRQAEYRRRKRYGKLRLVR